MKIPNPWPRLLIRCLCKPGDAVVVQCALGELEVPECEEVAIEPIKDRGRGKFESLAPIKLWSKKWGLLEASDHCKKMEIEKQEADLKKDQEKDAKRKMKEAKERGRVKKEIAEKHEPVIDVRDNSEALPEDYKAKMDMGKVLEL
jgi:hypothetical protein